MTIRGVLFDFSGTLLRIEPALNWLRVGLERVGVEVPPDELRRLAAELERAGALPGGSEPEEIPPELRGLWDARDIDAAGHRRLYVTLSRRVELPGPPELHEVLYDRHMEPTAWRPYPDTGPVLARLRERGVPVAVVSNIGWDLRPLFAAHGLLEWVDAFALSFEHGVQKPDPPLFAWACRELGVAPQQTLMVGDNATADGGATALGCTVHLVRHLPADERPGDLLPVLDLVG
ncbi:putative hydrolase of the HAD superfamily [Streptomyces zhaozhouensis]|uniref:Putative hydrolase of the HAD superfamily n=1 Tax=Streptomyces zhaozhouensis TaxID=1300267 RepID=A0A286DWC9_9ACTN|nr:HAD-IA family hydrolase [Streptomyces zhaozhouensis]SOD62987.1 putative hydrolase of the HAD superfamily [Streptomyces zhaozhouensis]